MNTQINQQLIIKDDNGAAFYGGDQSWYTSNCRAMAGCSSVAGANVLRTLVQRDAALKSSIKHSKKIPAGIKYALCDDIPTKEDYSLFMTAMYETMKAFEIFPLNKIYDRVKRNNKFFNIVKPNTGRSCIGFIRGLLKFAKQFGIELHVHSLTTAFCDSEKGLDFIRKGLDESGIVVLLTSFNTHMLRSYTADSFVLPRDDNAESEPGVSDEPVKVGTAIDSSQKKSKPLMRYPDAKMKCHFAAITGINEPEPGSPEKRSLVITTWGRVAETDYDELVKSWKSIKAWESALFYFTLSDTATRKKDARRSYRVFLSGLKQTLLRRGPKA